MGPLDILVSEALLEGMRYFPGETLRISEALCLKACLTNEGGSTNSISEFPALRVFKKYYLRTSCSGN